MSKQHQNFKTIAFVCQPYHRGGVTRWMADAAIKFAERGCRVYFVTVRPTTAFYSGKKAETIISLLKSANDNLKIISANVGRTFEFGLPEYCTGLYANLIVENIPAGTPLILSDDAAVWQAAIGLRESYPVIGVLHSDDPYYYALAKKYGELPDSYVCVSNRVAATLKQTLPDLDSNKIRVIPCGINLQSLKKNRIPSSTIRLIYVGRITEKQKRVFDLVRLGTQMQVLEIPFHFTIIGDGVTDRIALEKQVNATGLTHQYTFTGWLSKSDVMSKMVENDILVLTSDYEGTPVSMMEALENGCGFAGTRVSGIEDYEYHSDATNCFRVFDIGNIDQAVEAITELSQIPDEIRAQSARKLAESEFDLNICINRYSDMIETLPERSYKTPKVAKSISLKIKSLIISSLRRTKMKFHYYC